MDAPLVNDVEFVSTAATWGSDDGVALSEAGVKIDREFVFQDSLLNDHFGFVIWQAWYDLPDSFHQFTIGWDV